MDIKGLDKSEILKALYDNSRPLGLGFLQYKSEPISIEECRELLKKWDHFDYLHGRVMKIRLKGDDLVTRLYNRDNGENAAERIIDSIRRR